MAAEAAAAVATGWAASRGLFEYNRGNFFYDRMARRRMEFSLQEFRTETGKLWRKDVRDLISLTEKKMHAYLLVNVLLLAFTMVVWFEGDIEEPEGWLLLPYSLSLAGAGVFLIMSMWLAMHAAVTAQSYETRMLTQLVRLPLPTWREIEACRTYGSEFESVDARQMLRVPFAMGRQDRLVRGGAPASAAAAPGATSPPPRRRSADPWGFERPGEDITELGSRHGQDCAKLRHIRLTRQAMACWQSHDAFARICMNLGMHQLILALAYFLCGYAATTMRCNSVYAMGVVILLFLADTILRLDMSLSPWQLRRLEIVMALGPITSLLAVEVPQLFFGNFYLTELMMVFAYIFHGWFLKMLASHLQIDQLVRRDFHDEQDMVLPTAFRSVLYLDVFGWFQTLQQADELGIGIHAAQAGAAADDPPPPVFRRPSTRGLLSPSDLEAEAAPHGAAPVASDRPAVQAVGYRGGCGGSRLGGRPAACRPEDLVEAGAQQDLRHQWGAAHAGRDPADMEFYRPGSWLPGGGGDELDSPEEGAGEGAGEDADEWTFTRGQLGAAAPGGREVEDSYEDPNPKFLPRRLTWMLCICLCLAWICAAVYQALMVTGVFGVEEPFWEESPDTFVDKSSWNDDNSRLLFARRLAKRRDGKQRVVKRWDGKPAQLRGDLAASVEEVAVSWPFHWRPAALACSGGGRGGPLRLVATDGVALLSAELAAPAAQAVRRPEARFWELGCPAVEGEGLQDVALVCGNGTAGGEPCHAVVLHRQGGRVAACPLTGASADSPPPGGLAAGRGRRAHISGAWLDSQRGAAPGAESSSETVPHGRVEKPVALSLDAACQGAAGAPDWGPRLWDCMVLATTRGRVVRLRQRAAAAAGAEAELVPAEVVREPTGWGAAPWARGQARSLGRQRTGLLQAGDRSIAVFEPGVRAPAGRLTVPSSAGRLAAFCSSGDDIYALTEGPVPRLWRASLPPLAPRGGMRGGEPAAAA